MIRSSRPAVTAAAIAFVTSALVITAPSAVAQQAGAPTAAGAAAAPPPPAGDAVDDDERPDAHADRVVFLPTAMTQPAGTVYVTDYELIFLQVGYAVTGSTQISLTSMAPIIPGGITPFDISLKTSLIRRGPVRVAAFGSMSGLAGDVFGAAFGLVGRAGAVAQFCPTPRCDSSVTVGSSAILTGAVFSVNSVGGIIRVGRRAQLLMEVDTLVPLGNIYPQANYIAAMGGLRIPGQTWSFDLALMRVLNVKSNVAALPFVALTRRFGS